MSFFESVDRLLRSQQGRNFYGWIPAGQNLDASGEEIEFVGGEGYFEIDLAEAYLRDRREYWRGFVPFVVVVTDFIYEDQRKTIPFFVGNQLLSSIQKLIEGERVEYLNTRVVGPVPYAGDRLGLFVGLFRAQVTNLAENLFKFVEGVVRSFDVSRISSYLDIAGAVGNGLSDLMSLKEVELRIGMRDELGGPKAASRPLREGYLVYVNCNSADLDEEELWVKKGRLRVGPDRLSAEPYRDNDFCLLRLSHLSLREDYQTLPFYRLWRQVEEKVWEGEAEKARTTLLPRLAQELGNSPDLTRRHRFGLLQLFKANFESLVDSCAEFLDQGSGAKSSKATRGAGSLDARARVQQAAYVAKERKVAEGAKSLFGIAARWEEIPHLASRVKGSELSNQELNEQLRALEGLRAVGEAEDPDPEALAEALALDAVIARSGR